jgi:hypothetical protein
VRLRPNRGFPLDLAQQCHPQVLARMISEFSRLPFFCLKLMAARIPVHSNDRFIGGHVADECDAGSPGSDGALTELRPTCAGAPSRTELIPRERPPLRRDASICLKR